MVPSDGSLNMAVAVVGMAGRFPQADSIAQFWDLLRNGREGICRFKPDELIDSGVTPSIVQRPEYVPAKGYLAGAEDFESELFAIGPRDAQVIDPQQRLLLECSWQAMEDAGYDPFRIAAPVGVFAGVSMNSWLQELASNPEIINNTSGYQLMISNDKDYAATRVAYQLNLKGPAISIQTACSTSLVAIARACQSLASGEVDFALAGAASLAFPRKCGYLHQEGMILSPDGHCRAFDARANGTVPGEGVAMVVLRRLEDAIADGDHVEAVIRGWAVNNDGSDKIGFTAPSIGGQAEVIAAAQALAGVSPETISYIEAHGTATPLGDPIEIAALCEAFRPHAHRTGFCRIGSVKSNLGHLDTAAGIASFIKTVLALKHQEIPPTLHFESPNPEIDFTASPFIVNDRLTQWDVDGVPRRAGVSSFGIGGTNCHVIVEEAPRDKENRRLATRPARCQLLVFSGASPHAADQLQEKLGTTLADGAGDVGEVAFTLQAGRAELKHRRALVAADGGSAAATLRSGRAAELLIGTRSEESLPVNFLFPGQGSQFVGMGRALYDRFEDYRRLLDRCAEITRNVAGWDFRHHLFADPSDEKAAESLHQTAVAQPVLFATSYALASLLQECGIRPAAMAGHSVGELTAACLAEVMTLEDAMQIVVKRGELLQKMPAGAMLAVACEEIEELLPLLGDRCEIAARNAPGMFAVSGEKEAIDELKRQLDARGLPATPLQTSHGFHSHLIEPALDEFREFLGGFHFRPPRIPFASTLSGTWITAEEAISADYWTRQMRQTVRFDEAVRCLCRAKRQVLLEVGPGRALQTFVRQILGLESDNVVVSCMRSRDSHRPDDEVFLEAVGKMWVAGLSIPHWKRLHHEPSPRRVALPTYPFQRRTYSAGRDERTRRRDTQIRQIQKHPLSRWFYRPTWKRQDLSLPRDRSPGSITSRWLVFCREHGLAREIGQQIAASGDEVIFVAPGEDFAERSETQFTVNPRLLGNYTQLMNRVSSTGRPIDRVLHGWLAEPDAGSLAFEASQDLGFYSLLFLAQAVGRRPAASALRIDALTCDLHDILGNEPVAPGNATIRAPLLVIPQEYPHITCQHLDLTGEAVTQDRPWLVQQILAEIEQDHPGAEVAIRGRARWSRSFEPVILSGKEGRLDRQDGAWMVLGGFGRIGLTVASWIAHTKQSPVVLVGRKKMPQRDQWETWLQEHDADDPIAERLMAAKTIAEAGVVVDVETADIADLQSLRQAAQRVAARFGSIRGIVHSAGVVESRIIHYTGPADCRRQFAAKVGGIEALAAVAEEFQVPRCLINSSLSSVLGGIGFCGYTASNLFLDAFVERQNRQAQFKRAQDNQAQEKQFRSTQWTVVNWDGWLFPEAADLVKDNPAVHLTMSPEEGFSCLQLLDDQAAPDRVVVSTGDLQQRLAAWVNRQQLTETLTEPEEKEVATRHPRPTNLSSAFVEPRNPTEKAIVAVWEDLLGIEGIGANDNYIELGGHSLLAGQIIGRLREKLKTPISIRSLFEFPTVADLALHVDAVRLTITDDNQPSSGPPRVDIEF